MLRSTVHCCIILKYYILFCIVVVCYNVMLYCALLQYLTVLHSIVHSCSMLQCYVLLCILAVSYSIALYSKVEGSVILPK